MAFPQSPIPQLLAFEKAQAVAQKHPAAIVIGADTIVYADGRIIGKADDHDHAREIIELLFGSPHEVITGVALLKPDEHIRIVESVTTVVYPKKLTPAQIDEHIQRGDWQGKAGAYGIQETGDEFVERLDGSLTNVMGFPMELVNTLLRPFVLKNKRGKMIYKTYGSTGINVSAIGFGGMRFTNQDDVDACASLIKAAYDAGINYFDTSIGYGTSEDLFGVAIKEMSTTRKQKPFYIATKTMQPNPADVRRECETSLKRMGVDSIDFYHVWCILTPDAYRERKANGVMKEFEKLKSEGLIKHICVSSHMTGSEIAAMLNDYPFEGILLGYSASNFAYREAGIEAAAKLNRGVVAMNPLAGGVIPQNPDRFSFVKTRPDETVVEGAIRFLLNDPRITVALVGLSDKEQLDEAIRAVDGFTPIAPKAVRKIRNSIKEAFNELCTGCRYCDSCPQGIPIPKLMDAYNQYLLTGKPKDILDRLGWHWGIGRKDEYLTKCTRCGQCEKACTQKLPICERLQFIRDEAKKALTAEAQKN